MYSNYTLIDDNFLKNIHTKKRKIIVNAVYEMYLSMGNSKSKKLPKNIYFQRCKITKYKFTYFYCAHCNQSGIMPCPFYGKVLDDMKYCVSCGEPHIMMRFCDGYDKVMRLILLSQIISPKQDTKACRDLNQQIVVLLLSTIEVYLRDFYVTLLNMKYTKKGESLSSRFKKDCKNDFQNASKSNERFIKELGINFKKVVGEEYFSKFIEYSAYRNIIIHNNGVCDATFISNKIGNYQLHDTIFPKIDLILKYAQDTKTAIDALEKEYECIYINKVYERSNL